MGYFLMPQSSDTPIEEIAMEAAVVFIKNHGKPTGGLDMQVDEKRRVLLVTDKVTGASELFTFAELGFL